MYQNPTNYDLLAEAIVAQAAKDYLELRKFLHNTREGKEARKATKELRDIRKFFNSRWYKTLTEVDGNYLMERLDKEFEEWKKEQV
jgi:hypothetical protein